MWWMASFLSLSGTIMVRILQRLSGLFLLWNEWLFRETCYYHGRDGITRGIQHGCQWIHQCTDDHNSRDGVDRQAIYRNHQHFADISTIRNPSGNDSHQNGDPDSGHNRRGFEKVPS